MAKKITKKTDSIKCTIKESFGFLNADKSKIFAIVSWNDRDPKFDIRKCYEKDNELMLGSGISLTEEEMDALSDLYSRCKKRAKTEPVNFDDIFSIVSQITEKRKKGYTTENGYIVLHRKKK